MLKKRTFAIIGGDMRQVHLANALASREEGYTIYAMYLDQDVKLNKKIILSNDLRAVLPQADIVVFPLPMMNGGGNLNTPLSAQKASVDSCLEYISQGAVVLGGRVPEVVRRAALARGIEPIDYLLREEFAVLNAVPTALSKVGWK